MRDSLNQWLEYLESMHPVAIDMGLERVATVGARLDLRFACPVIPVGGTNGKGPNSRMLERLHK